MNKTSLLTVALLSATCLTAPLNALAAPCANVISGNQAACTVETLDQNVTVNSGVTVTAGAATDAIDVIGSNRAGNLTNNGQLNATDGSGIRVRPAGLVGNGANNITNSQTGIINADVTGIWAQRGVASILNNGQINVTRFNGIHADGIRVTGSITNNTLGNIHTMGGTGNNSIGILINNNSIIDGDVINRGILRGYGAIHLSGPTASVGGTIGNGNIINTSQRSIAIIGSTAGAIRNENGASITSTLGHVMDLDGATITNGIVNNGIINAAATGIRLFKTKVLNNGITLGTTSSITGNAGIEIESGSNPGEEAIVTGDLFNRGSISADAYGVYLNSGRLTGDIVNDTTGTITSDTHGIWLSSNTRPAYRASVDDIINRGTITTNGASGDGILVEASDVLGRIDNQRTINSGHQGIRVDDGSTVAEGIINNGTITAVAEGIAIGNNSTIGVDFTDGASLVNTANGKITGLIGTYIWDSQLDGDILNRGEITGTGTDSLTGAGAIVIENSALGGITNATSSSSIVGYDGIKVTTATMNGGILNNGRIEGWESDGINLTETELFGDIVNNGYIFGDSDGIDLPSLTVIHGDVINGVNGIIEANDNAIEIGGSNGMQVLGSLINHGIIDGASSGINLEGGEITGDVVNNRRIVGGDEGLYIEDFEIGGVIRNAAGAYIGGTDYAVSINTPVNHLTFNNYGELDGAIRIENTTLNLEEGSIATGAIGGNGGIVNIKTNISTVEEYGAQDGTLDEINVFAGKTFTSHRGSNTLFDTLVFNNDGTFRLVGDPDNNVVATVFWDYAQTADGIFSFDAQLPTVFSSLNVNGIADFAADTGIHVNITGNEFDFANGAAINNVITAGTLNASTFTVTDSSYLYNFTSTVDGNTVDLQSVVDNTRSVSGAVNQGGSNPASDASGVINDIITAGPVGDMRNVVNAIASLSTAEEVTEAVRQTLPTLTGGSTTAVLQTLGTTNQIVQARQEQNAGLSSGEGFVTEGNAWVKPFGTWSEQGERDGVIGYDADTYGLVAGMDGAVSDGWRLGVALAYAKTDVKSNDSLSRLDVDTYQATVYGSYVIDARTEANFQIDGGYNNNDSRRGIVFGGLNRTAEGDFDGYALHAGTGIGQTWSVGEKTTFTPSARLDYSLLHNEGYTESGAGALNLDVDSQTTDQLIPSISAKVNHEIDPGLTVTANAGIGYDVLNERNSVTSNFVGGGAAFVTDGLESSPWMVRTGAGLTYTGSNDYDVTVRYDREDRSDFDSQTASVKVRMPF